MEGATDRRRRGEDRRRSRRPFFSRIASQEGERRPDRVAGGGGRARCHIMPHYRTFRAAEGRADHFGAKHNPLCFCHVFNRRGPGWSDSPCFT